MVHATQAGPIRDGVGHYVESLVMGSNTLFVHRAFTSNRHVDSDVVLRDGDDHWVSLSPWVVWRTCESCQHESIWLYEGHDDRAITVRESGRDHQVSLPMEEAPRSFRVFFAAGVAEAGGV